MAPTAVSTTPDVGSRSVSGTLIQSRVRRCEGCGYMRPESALAAYLVAGTWVYLYCGACDAARVKHPAETPLGATR